MRTLSYFINKALLINALFVLISFLVQATDLMNIV